MTAPRRPRARVRSGALAVVVAVGVLLAGVVPADADPGTTPAPGGSAATASQLEDVTARADALQAEVDRLGLAVEQAAEDHAAAEERLHELISSEIVADTALSAAQTVQAEDAGTAGRRARALYMTGGTATLLQNVLTSDASDRSTADGLADLATDLRTVRTLVGDDAARVASSAALVDHAVQASADVQALRAERQTVEAQVAQAATDAEEALAQQQQLLAQTDAQVVQLADRLRAEREAEALAEAQRVAAELAAQQAAAAAAAVSAGGTISGPTAAATAAIAAAQTALGRPYQWGAVGPATFDCSGLTSWAYRQAGVSIPRTSRAQYYGLPKVPLSDLQPGDLVFYGFNGDPSTIHHVVLYLGGGRVLHAPQTGDVVKISGLSLGGAVGAVRPTGAVTTPAPVAGTPVTLTPTG